MPDIVIISLFFAPMIWVCQRKHMPPNVSLDQDDDNTPSELPYMLAPLFSNKLIRFGTF
jgi:hypothetical protein